MTESTFAPRKIKSTFLNIYITWFVLCSSGKHPYTPPPPPPIATAHKNILKQLFYTNILFRGYPAKLRIHGEGGGGRLYDKHSGVEGLKQKCLRRGGYRYFLELHISISIGVIRHWNLQRRFWILTNLVCPSVQTFQFMDFRK